VTDNIVFTRGVPPPEAFPTDELGECLDAAIRNDTAVVLQYGQQPGYAPFVGSWRRSTVSLARKVSKPEMEQVS
jgi:DNA-binding transcriptional MocR family regulator